MIKYSALLKDKKNRTVQIYSGEVSDIGKIVLDTKGLDVDTVEIEWRRNGNDSND